MHYLREANQKAQRVGRGNELGVVREIYNKQDFPTTLEHLANNPETQLAHLIQAYAQEEEYFESKLYIMQTVYALNNLHTCDLKSRTARDRSALQNEFFRLYRNADSASKQWALQPWGSFYKQNKDPVDDIAQLQRMITF